MERIRFHPPGRPCELPTCTTVLNHFNPGPLCLHHQEQAAAMPLLEFRHEGMARLWVAIQLTRRGLPAGRATTAAID